MERCHGNPAHLIRQARKSMVGEDDATHGFGNRNRRWSAPPGGDPADIHIDVANFSSVGGSLHAKAFKTKSKAAVRTLPSAVSLKISDLPQGWKVAEAQNGSPAAGSDWIAIEPRGYVLAEELIPTSPLRRGEPLQPEAVHRPSRRASMTSSFEAAATEVSMHEAVPTRSASRPDVSATSSSKPKEPWRYGPCRRTEVVSETTVTKSARRIETQPPTEAIVPKSARRTEVHTSGAKTLSKSASMRAPVAQSPRAVPPSSPTRGTGAMSPSRAPRVRSNPGVGQSPLRQSPPVEVLLEHVQLRESNVDLREKELEKRRELEDLARARETIAREVRELEQSRRQLQDQHELEQLELERQQLVIKEKLSRCRDAVAIAVGSIDELYAQQEAAPNRRSTTSSCGPGFSNENTSIIPEEVCNAKAVAEEAGMKVSQMLDRWDEANQENTGVPNIVSKKTEEVSCPDRTPLRACNLLVSP